MRHQIINIEQFEVGEKPKPKRGGSRIGYYKPKTHCPHGHAYTEDNITWIKTARGTPTKICRACKRKAMKKYLKNRSYCDF